MLKRVLNGWISGIGTGSISGRRAELGKSAVVKKPDDSEKASGSVGQGATAKFAKWTGSEMTAEEWLKSPADRLVPVDLLHPDKEGLEPVSSRELMDANRQLIEQCLQSFSNKSLIHDFDTQILELIRRVAHWMGPFPASRGHHHAGRGGLFTHSIGVATSALHMSVTKNVVTSSSPRERDADILAWQLACFVGGLLHDIGKLNTTGRIFPLAIQPDGATDGSFRSSAAPLYNRPWEPMVEGFEGWVKAHRIRSYYIDFDFEEALSHRDFTVRYVMALVPRPILSFIYNSGSLVRQHFEDFIRNPESPSRMPIFQVIQDADHLNVAQSVDPRRNPGTVEMTGLVLRRFAEYAAEARWNLPNSPFVYAHVEKKNDNGVRFFGMPFFVATEASIEGFLRFISSRPLLGVSLGDHARHMIFDCLTKHYVMNPTVEGLLPHQIKADDLQDYIPASRAKLRFRAHRVEGVLKAVEGQDDDLIIELPVIPIKMHYPTSAGLTAPTLSFHAQPSSSSAAVIPVSIDKGKAAPADAALRNDPAYMESILKEMTADLGEKGAADAMKTIGDLPRAHRPRSHAGSVGREIRSPLKTMREKSERKAELQNLSNHSSSDAPTREAPAASSLEPAAAAGHPDGTPAWLRCYLDVSADLDSQPPQVIWAVAWLYIADHPSNLIRATTDGKGDFIFRASTIPKKIREEIVMKLAETKASIALLSRHWENSRINVTDPAMADCFDASASPRESHTAKLHPISAELIKKYQNYLIVDDQALDGGGA